ncbi:MAG TPA: cobalamin-binding protein [Usitatibacter sp.]|nr:cobalamin-binding protein [Usitatibacter sp.]
MLSALLLAASIALTDDLGREVKLDRPARRIVALAPFLTELAFAAGVGDRVVGVSAYSDYPEAARALPQVSSSAGFSLEQIAALNPDLVLVWRDSMRRDEVDRIERFGASVYVANARTLEDVPRALDAIGRLGGVDVTARARAYREGLRGLRAKYSARRKLDVLLEIGHRPLMTIAGPHFMNEALEICGARNVFSDLPGVAPVIAWEQVYARDPEVVVGAGSGGDAATFQANWRDRATLSAVKNARLVYVDADTILRPSLRLVQGVAQLCEGLERARR